MSSLFESLPTFLSLACLSQIACATTDQPVARNVVILLADDLGYADVGYHGCKDVPTPNIDRLATQGVQFTDGYVTGSVCGPTRAGLMSGRYQQKLGAQNNIGERRIDEETPYGLPLDVTTLADRFQELGFVTGCFGKWHLGGELLFDKRLFPTNRGFNEFYGFLEGAARYEDANNVERKYIRGETVLDGEDAYYTEALGREAVSFIKRHKDERFFLYVPFNAVHAPMQATEADLQRMAHIKDPNRRTLAAMLISLDDQVGHIMQTLETEGISDDTLLVFLSDNGGKPNNNYSLNHPLRGEKNTAFEGGIRIPYCMQWPAALKAGQTRTEPISSLDLFPTTLNAVGGSINPAWQLDGINLVPALLTDGEIPTRPLYWKARGHQSIRHGDWKLINQHNTGWQLFNLSEDLAETTDLAQQHPEQATSLKANYDTWDAQNKPGSYGWDKALPFHSTRVPR